MRQVRAEGFYKRDVQWRETVQVRRRKRHKPRQMFRGAKLLYKENSLELIEASWLFQDELDHCHSEDATRASREWLRENGHGPRIEARYECT